MTLSMCNMLFFSVDAVTAVAYLWLRRLHCCNVRRRTLCQASGSRSCGCGASLLQRCASRVVASQWLQNCASHVVVVAALRCCNVGRRTLLQVNGSHNCACSTLLLQWWTSLCTFIMCIANFSVDRRSVYIDDFLSLQKVSNCRCVHFLKSSLL